MLGFAALAEVALAEVPGPSGLVAKTVAATAVASAIVVNITAAVNAVHATGSAISFDTDIVIASPAIATGAVQNFAIEVDTHSSNIQLIAAIGGMVDTATTAQSGVFGSGVVAAVGIVDKIGSGIFATGVVANLGMSRYLSGIFSTALVQALTILEPETVASVFGSSAIGPILVAPFQISLTGVNGQGQGAAVTPDIPQLFATSANAVVNGVIVQAAALLAGSNSVGAAQGFAIGAGLGPLSATGFVGPFSAPVTLTLPSVNAAASLGSIISSTPLGISGVTASAQVGILIKQELVSGASATGIVVAPFSLIFNATLPGAAATSTVNPFTPIGFFDGAAAFAITSGLGVIEAETGSVFASGQIATLAESMTAAFGGANANSGPGVFAIQELLSPLFGTAAIAIANQQIAIPQKFALISGVGVGVAANAFATIVSSLAVGAQGMAESLSLTFASSINILGISASAFANAGIIPAFGIGTSGVNGIVAFPAASSMQDSSAGPMFATSALGAVSPVLANIITNLAGTFANGVALNLGESFVGIQSSPAASVAASAFQEIVGLGQLGVSALGGIGQLAKEILLSSAVATGESAAITQFVLSDSPVLSGAVSTGAVGLFSILPALTGIQAIATVGQIVASPGLIAVIAIGQTGKIIFIDVAMGGASAFGNLGPIAIFILSFDINNAINIHGVASKNLPPG